MKILGIDPGTSIVGYSILEKKGGDLRLIAADAIKTAPKIPQEEKLLLIKKELTSLIDLYKPDTIALEKLFFFKNAKTVISVAEARGVILLTGQSFGLRVYEFTPLEIKMAVTGYGKADKKQVQMMTGAILKLKEVPRLDDVTDAIAVAICAAHRAPPGDMRMA